MFDERKSNMNNSSFYIAANIAHWATILDESKADYPASLRAKALECADQMHLMAQALAGARTDEIYGDMNGFGISKPSDFIFTNLNVA
jgi:hypothetical protein